MLNMQKIMCHQYGGKFGGELDFGTFYIMLLRKGLNVFILELIKL